MKPLFTYEKVKKLKLAAEQFNEIKQNLKLTLILTACLVLSACATKKEVATTDSIKGQMQGDVYTGTDTVEYLAEGVPDGFAMNVHFNNCI